jgi:hypothetical protein
MKTTTIAVYSVSVNVLRNNHDNNSNNKTCDLKMMQEFQEQPQRGVIQQRHRCTTSFHDGAAPPTNSGSSGSSSQS